MSDNKAGKTVFYSAVRLNLVITTSVHAESHLLIVARVN